MVYARETRGICRHCKKDRMQKARGLCRACYNNKGICSRYMSIVETRTGIPILDEDDTLPTRQPGEPAYRCLWCGRYRNDDPMRLCNDCQHDYEQLAAGMPDDSHGECGGRPVGRRAQFA